MALIISKNNKGAQIIDESDFDLEDHLQAYIYENPQVIPIYEIEEDARLFIAAREFATESGPIDAFGFDEHGNIYVIETKLFKNADKRRVVAQVLDYGASLWQHSSDFDQFIEQLDIHTNKQFSKSFEEKFKEFFELDDITDNLESIKQNLSEGSIKFVVLMNTIDDRLKDLIMYVNQNSKFDIYAVDFKYYKHEEFEIVIPKLYGSEVKKTVTSKTSSPRKQWNDDLFFDAVNNDHEHVSDIQRDVVYKLWNWAKSHEAQILWGTASIFGTFSPVFHQYFNRSFVTVSIDGYIRINYGHLDQYPEAQRQLREILRKHLQGQPVEAVYEIADEELNRKYPAISAQGMPRYVDVVINAFDEFLKWAEKNYGN